MTDTYKTISSTAEGYYTEKRSKFLAFAHHVESVDDVKQIVYDDSGVILEPEVRMLGFDGDKT